ncbi:MAG: VanZ family protein [Bacillota bacterium]|jgi:VanZ family protein|nr:VanZ family protein [Bacillota bacterium]HHT89449.1 VanZ family protein [Bacillota bacterium]
MLIQWAIVAVYVIAMFLFAGQEASSAGFSSTLLQRLWPHLTRSELRHWVLVLRKAGHFLAYAVLTLLVYYAARRTKKLQRAALPIAAAFAFLVAIADENYQSRLHYRTGTWQDVLIDGLGIALTVLGVFVCARIRKKRKEVAKEDVENEY